MKRRRTHTQGSGNHMGVKYPMQVMALLKGIIELIALIMKLFR
jgi:hypothetical protein